MKFIKKAFLIREGAFNKRVSEAYRRMDKGGVARNPQNRNNLAYLFTCQCLKSFFFVTNNGAKLIKLLVLSKYFYTFASKVRAYPIRVPYDNSLYG